MDARALQTALALLRAYVAAYCLRLRCLLVIRTRCLRWLPGGGEECERRQSVLIFPF
ncbi:MC137 [Molluscum contagiosum virus subtype 2]|uniref:MC137 n=2 Tax=Molluscum contagiosum virus TaxID=10279 RepID=A0A1S7DLW9_MCV2|nr:MC137 [Molluscum contagiosum virus subtype 2]QHW16525.1 MC137L [Molluscum contagiosum virus]AYO87772.1 MC137 [Molluscum contagiosum virus subtype 2]AYO87942.1 MC137 [Molluscum contagiosum virus subtype 2]AYO88112.1 MC137 [Molluscum contagiosum virus subtype 2]